MINNYGGLSNLEVGALTGETLSQLGKRFDYNSSGMTLIRTEENWDIKPTKIYSGPFETSLNGPGFSITLCNLTLAAKQSNTSVSELMGLLAAETKAPSWPNVLSNSSTKVQKKEIPTVDLEKRATISPDEDIKGT